MNVGRPPDGDEPSDALNILSNRVIGAALEVHRVLGPGFVEAVYKDALAVELELRGIPHAVQQQVAVAYKGRPVGQSRLDILVADSLVVELKAVEVLLPIHTAQLLSSLKATGHKLGLLINFNVPLLRDGIRRLILKNH
jgi:GxxExxY protein